MQRFGTEGLRITSERQAAAHAARTTPEVEEVREGIFAIAVPMTVPSLPYSYCYAIDSGTGALHLIDSGVDSDDNWHHLERAIHSIGYSIADIATVSATHLHVDHAGLAARIRAASGATVGMHLIDDRAVQASATFVPVDSLEETLDRWEVPPDHRDSVRSAASRRVAPGPSIPVDRLFADADELDAGRGLLRTLHVPGHTAGHIAFALDDERVVFVGDHLLPTMFAGVGLGGRTEGDNPIGDYLRSLTVVAELDGYEVLPGHGYRFEGIAQRSEATRLHHDERSQRIADLAGRSAIPSIWNIASQLEWTGGWENLTGTNLFSALSQTEMHLHNLKG